jgi:protein TonB
MYRTDLNPRDRGGAIAAVVAIHAALLFAFLNMSGKIDIRDTQRALQLFDVDELKRPPPPPPPPSQQQTRKPKEKEGGSSPKNIKSEATPVAAPTPRIALPLPVPIPATQTPRQGTASTQGASDVRGPGTGAGGSGTGTGSGSGGSGPGGGGEGAAYPPQLLTPTLRGRDFPNDLLDMWPRGAQVFLRLRIDARGYVIECIVDRGTGVAAIDSEVCAQVHARFRYRPALSRSGQPVAGWAGYRQTPPR